MSDFVLCVANSTALARLRLVWRQPIECVVVDASFGPLDIIPAWEGDPMSGYQSAELKLRDLAAQYPALIADLTWPNTKGDQTFQWFDRQVVQGDLGKPSDGRYCVTVQRVSSPPRVSNQGSPNTPLSQPRFQFNIVGYNSEKLRSIANDVVAFMNSISLCNDGYYLSPVTGATQNPNYLLNERSGMLAQLQPPAYVHTQDWRCYNREDFPGT